MNKMPSRLLLLFMVATMLWSCSSTERNIERGNSYIFAIGYPEIRFSAAGIIDENDVPLISTATEVIVNSLIFKNVEEQSVAEILFEIRVREINTGTLAYFTDVVNFNKDEVINDAFTIKRDFFVDPGAYEVAVTVTDNNTLKDISLVANTVLPDPRNPEVNLTNIVLSAKDEESNNPNFFPISTYDVPLRMDSLRFEFQITNNDSDDPLQIRAALIQFEADTLPADPMSYNDYLSGTIRYIGYDIHEKETITSSTRLLTQPGSVDIEFLFPILSRGNYRFEVVTEDREGNTIYKARDFSIKSPNYPDVKNVRELALPLKYLMNKNDYNDLLKIEDDLELKQAMDRFWLKNLENPNIARQIIELYYERVEHANRYFSNYKEGWKTDAGMMYILFGRPWYVDEAANQMRWSYSYNYSDPQKNFVFVKPKPKSAFFPFEHYLLNRESEYFNLEYRQVQLWLTGLILQSNL